MNEYLQSADIVLAQKQVTKNGLDSAEAAKRLEAYGMNRLEEGKKKGLPLRIWEQVRDPMVLVLIASAIISMSFGEITDTVIILIVVALNAALGVFQENKAEKAIEALQKLSAPLTRVRRGGGAQTIQAQELVPGDIVLLEAGDSVPADMRLIECVSLKIEEAALTGESVPAEKQIGELRMEGGDVPLGDRVNMAYMGTSVVYGRGTGVVTATGMSTEMGKIAGILSDSKEERTPLQQKLAGLSTVLSMAVLGICIFIFVFSLFMKLPVLESLLTAVSLAVAAIPEGLIVVVTILLSIGVTRMSRKNAIIRRLTAVETLGCTQVICSDKTGTLTQNKMTVVEHFGHEWLLAEAVYFCNDALPGSPGEGFIGDPTETALAEYAQKRGLTAKPPRAGEAPFDSTRKMMSTLHIIDGNIRQYSKGAPDEILTRCTHIIEGGSVIALTEEHKRQITGANGCMAGQALRVLGAAMRDYNALPLDLSPENIERDMTFIGLVGMIDPVRPEVKTAIETCKQAGVRAIMITGDHKDTAMAIARELGILRDERQAITGAELARLSDDEFAKRAEEISVYARVQPEHKVRIVEMWRKKGNITAMTGDGVNDAPALKNADIGVGMGISGTDVTKNVADMVLSDDNFASIVYAVEEGRRIYENIRKAIQFLLGSNLAEVISIFIATLLSVRLFAPIHILWINLVTDTFPAMALGMEETETDSMRQPPRNPKENIFANGLGAEVIAAGIILAALTLAAYFLGNRIDHITGMTMAFVTLSMGELFNAIALRSRTKSIFALKTRNIALVGATFLSTVLTLGVIYIPGINDIFALTPLSMGHFLTALGISAVIIPSTEVMKIL